MGVTFKNVVKWIITANTAQLVDFMKSHTPEFTRGFNCITFNAAR